MAPEPSPAQLEQAKVVYARVCAHARRELKSLAEQCEEQAAGITGPACPFCMSRHTYAYTDGWPGQEKTGSWWCDDCGESGSFDEYGLHWLPEGDPSI